MRSAGRGMSRPISALSPLVSLVGSASFHGGRRGRVRDLFRTQPGRGSWLAEMVGRLAVRYPEVPVIFAGSRKLAEEWAYRFLSAAVADHTESS